MAHYISAKNIVDVDNDVIATAPVITDDDILEQFQKDHSPESDKEESALDVRKNASLFSNTEEEMQCVIFKFENLFTKERINSLKQSDITEFF